MAHAAGISAAPGRGAVSLEGQAHEQRNHDRAVVARLDRIERARADTRRTNAAAAAYDLYEAWRTYHHDHPRATYADAAKSPAFEEFRVTRHHKRTGRPNPTEAVRRAISRAVAKHDQSEK